MRTETEYYDGPVAGVVKCLATEDYFRFETLDWEDKQEVRVFGLAQLDEIEDADRQAIPSLDGSSFTSDDALTKILRRYVHIDLLVAWQNPDLTVIALRDVRTMLLRFPEASFFDCASAERDWFLLLGLPRAE